MISRSIRAVKLLATDGRIPRPLRWLMLLGVAPVPGPFDEIVLLIAAALLFIFYRRMLREAWSAVAKADPALSGSRTKSA